MQWLGSDPQLSNAASATQIVKKIELSTKSKDAICIFINFEQIKNNALQRPRMRRKNAEYNRKNRTKMTPREISDKALGMRRNTTKRKKTHKNNSLVKISEL